MPARELCFEFADYLSRMMDLSVQCIYFGVLLLVLRDYKSKTEFYKCDLSRFFLW